MGKSNARPMRPCATVHEHVGHLWSMPTETSSRVRVWCPGVEALSEVRYPFLPPQERIPVLRERVECGLLSAEDRREIAAIADGLIEAFAPLVEAFTAMAEVTIAAVNAFFEMLSPETIAEMAELTKAYGEKPDKVEILDIAQSGTLIDSAFAMPFLPIPARSAASNASEEDVHVEPEGEDDGAHMLILGDGLADTEHAAFKRESRFAQREIFGRGTAEAPWFRPEGIQQIAEDLARHDPE